jgi:hypothetical protein
MKGLAAYIGLPRPTSLTHSGFLPTTVIATPDGWRSASSILPGDTVLSPGGTAVRVHDVQLTPVDPYDGDTDPIYIPSYALGNLTDMTVLPDQMFQLSKNILGVQHTTRTGQVAARDLVGLNGIRACDTDEMPIAITLTFEKETVICCAHGSFAVCSQTQKALTTEFGPLLTA